MRELLQYNTYNNSENNPGDPPFQFESPHPENYFYKDSAKLEYMRTPIS
jgi:hypothetical protein